MERYSRKIILLSFAIFFCVLARAQSYYDEIALFRKTYIADLLKEERQPIKKGDEKYIRFFAIDPSYRIEGTFKLTPGARPFLIQTHSNKQKPFVEYGTISFSIRDTAIVLHVYKALNPLKSQQDDELFIPFNDRTNYELTYGGGRYIDLKTSEIKNERVVIDFNKSYNPYCAYSDGFSCPIPPDENHLSVCIFAGEKTFSSYSD